MSIGRRHIATPSSASSRPMLVAALIPAHNEADSIAATIEAVLSQTRVPDRIIVIPNGCTDDTAAIASRYPVTVLDLPALAHRKSEALNVAWNRYARDADVVICLDADTVLPDNAVRDWEAEMLADDRLGGSSSKFTMLGDDWWTTLQRFEFARWTDTSLRRGWTSVLAGTGCAISGEALRHIVDSTRRVGPWSYDSQVEDFELTYRIREAGWHCHVSPTVRAYTDSMKNLRALWGQRMKWQVGTVEDLLTLGVNRLTLLDWRQQAAGMFAALVRILWVLFTLALVLTGGLVFTWYWWLLPPLLFIASDVRASLLVPHRTWRDVAFAAALVPQEVFAWVRAAWFLAAWGAVVKSKITRRRTDRWAAQYIAEGR